MEEEDEDLGSEPGLTAVDPPRIGGMVGPYRLERELGRGGTATVYLARHVGEDRLCALKMIQGQFLGSGRLYRRLLREARVMSALRHENVAMVLDAGGPPDAPPYLVTEYVRGLRLSELIKQQGSLSPRLTAKILRSVASGLGAAHAMDIVHRDVKPSNVIVGPDAEGSGVKLLDFGLARALRLDIHGTVLTRAQDFLGTPSYMAPEQIRDPSQAGPKSDLYSAGMMAYVMLSGRKGRQSFDSIAALVAADLTVLPLDERGPLPDLIMRLCAVDPAMRPKSAAEVIDEIDRMWPQLEERSSARPNKGRPPPVPEPSLIVERSDVVDPHDEASTSPKVKATGDPSEDSWITGVFTKPGQFVVRLVRPKQPSHAIPLVGLVLATILVGVASFRAPPDDRVVVPFEPSAPEPTESPTPRAEPAEPEPGAVARPLSPPIARPAERPAANGGALRDEVISRPEVTSAMVKANLERVFKLLDELDGRADPAELDALEARYFELAGGLSRGADDAQRRALFGQVVALERELKALRATN